jgi:hypothetical protein
MPIKWSAVKVSQAMDEVERQVCLAESFFAEAKTKAKEARTIPNLPQYLDQRLIRLISDIERIDRVKDSIKAVRNTIPDGTIEVERERLKYGSQQSII